MDEQTSISRRRAIREWASLASIYVQLAASDASYSTGQVYAAAGGQGMP